MAGDWHDEGMHALVIGEALVDVLGEQELVGGSAANVAIALARLGRATRFATCYAEDDRGAAIAAALEAAGVLPANDHHGAARTSSATARLAADGSASYEFDLTWTPRPLDPAAEAGAVLVHVCSIGAVLSPGAELVVDTVRRLRGHALISYDINARPSITGTGDDLHAAMGPIIASAHLVKASDEDVETLLPGLTVEEAARTWLSAGPDVVVITRGDAGATWFDRRGSVSVPAPLVDVVDTIGAGDTFHAGLLDALWQFDALSRLVSLGADQITSALEHAARAGAIAVSRAGANPPSRAELGTAG